jgi:hypothetical protein
MKIVLGTHSGCSTNSRCAVEFGTIREKQLKKAQTSDRQTLGKGSNFQVRISQPRIPTRSRIDWNFTGTQSATSREIRIPSVKTHKDFICSQLSALEVWSLHYAPFISMLKEFTILKAMYITGPPLWSSGHSSWLQIRRSLIRFPGTTRKKISGSRTGSTEPREYNWGATRKSRIRS